VSETWRWWWPFAALSAGCVIGALLGIWEQGDWQVRAIVLQTVVLAITAGFVVWYASAAHRQAEILKDQFDVQYRPHLRPDVDTQTPHDICIRLTNLSGAPAIHPGVYPQWTTPHKRNGELRPMPDLTGHTEEDDFATCRVLRCGDERSWWVRKPKPGESWDVKVQWGEPPWEIRDEHIWPLEPNPDPRKKGQLHFVPPRD